MVIVPIKFETLQLIAAMNNGVVPEVEDGTIVFVYVNEEVPPYITTRDEMEVELCKLAELNETTVTFDWTP